MAKTDGRFWRSLFSSGNVVLLVGMLVAAAAPIATAVVSGRAVDPVLLGIMAFLTAMAVSQIIASYDAIRRDKRLEELAERIAAEGKTPLRLRRELEPLPERASEARSILIIGRAPLIVLKHRNFLVQRLQEGATIRVAMSDPANPVVIDSLAAFTGRPATDYVIEIKDALSMAHKVAHDAGRRGDLQVRLLNYMQTLSFCVVDPKSESGHMVVELLPRGMDVFERPHMLLEARRDRVWFDYFLKVAETIWEDAIPCSSLPHSDAQGDEGR